MTARCTFLLIAIVMLSVEHARGQSSPIAPNLPFELSVEHCAFTPFYERQMQQPEIKAQQEVFERRIYQRALELKRARYNGRSVNADNETLSLPIVIHVIHYSNEPSPGDGYSNPQETQILAGIDHLNQAFRNVGVFAENGHNNHSAVQSVDVGIEFCLAKSDIYGKPTTGIIRYSSDEYTELNADFEDPAMQQWVAEQNGNAFPSTDYINVWLVSKICRGSGTTEDPLDCNKGGYGYYPATHGETNNGVVNLNYVWGASELTSKIHIHEFGHFLGLYHTFQSGCANGNCLTNGDRVCDTPPDNRTSFGDCGEPDNSCNTDADDTSDNNPFKTDVDDLYENYMDYTSKYCQNTFTQGQADRMRSAVIEVRNSLLQSKGCSDADGLSDNQPGGCSNEELVLFMDEINSGTYEDAEAIFAAGELEPNAKVSFRASATINLLPGFKVLQGSTFNASLQACEQVGENALTPTGMEETTLDRPIDGPGTTTRFRTDLEIAPNPIVGVSLIRYYLPENAEKVSLLLMDVNGRKMRDIQPENLGVAGWQQTNLYAGDLPSGMYALLLRVDDHLLTQQVMIVN